MHLRRAEAAYGLAQRVTQRRARQVDARGVGGRGGVERLSELGECQCRAELHVAARGVIGGGGGSGVERAEVE